MKAKEIRAKARENMSGKWGKFLGMNLLYLVVQVICIVICFVPFISTVVSLLVGGAGIIASGSEAELTSFATEIATSLIGSFALCYLLLLVVVVITVPLAYSFIKNVMELKRDDSVKATQFFKQWFKNFTRAWKVTLWKMWKIFSIYLIFIAAYIGAIILMAIFTAIGVKFLSAILGIAIFVGLIVFEVIMIQRSFAITLSEYIAVDNDDMTAKDCVNKSMELMNGYKWKLFCLILSFIGWEILCVFTLGIGYLFLSPYMQVSLVCFYENVPKDKGENIKKDEETVKPTEVEVITEE